MVKEKNKPVSKKEIENLLSQQTIVILNAVDKKLEKFETKISIRIDKLRNTIDKFVTLYTKQEQELTLVIEDIRKIKKVIREKLGVEIT